MARRRLSEEDILNLLRQIELSLDSGAEWLARPSKLYVRSQALQVGLGSQKWLDSA